MNRIAAFALLILTAAVLPAAPSLPDALAAIIDNDPISARTSIGVQVVDAQSGDVVFERNPDVLFTPASNMKLYTSACALATWGADHQFETDIVLGGALNDGALEGDLVLRGGGDPTLTSADLAALAQRVRAELGVQTVSGAVVVDESLFDPTRKGPGWMWDDDPDAYNMSLSAIMLDYNVLTAVVRPAAEAGSAAQVALAPASDYPPFANSALTGAGGDIRVTRRPFTDTLLVSGAIAPGSDPVTTTLTMHDPARWIGGVFAQMLSAEGIAISGGMRVVTERVEGEPALTFEGRPLSEVLALFNKPSENAIGEMLIHDLAADGTAPATWRAGAEVIAQWLTEQVGLSANDFAQRDGSGVSRYDMICASGTCRLLRHMWQRPDRQVYVDSLPIAGVDGTIRSRMGGTAAAGNVHAKTGTMTGVSTLSGYVTTAGGRDLIFSILVNGINGSSAPARDLQDRLCVAMAETG